ncbi:MAG: hypothetical protein A6F71_05430 [Cycloclasticus sp. symbiont of Poecilosclerida sp. M]|nr:MAG: hypothetical protein A6F71_05430 [Cycloclasticus sp. symbiont of Poecilosclerida sp. M]
MVGAKNSVSACDEWVIYTDSNGHINLKYRDFFGRIQYCLVSLKTYLTMRRGEFEFASHHHKFEIKLSEMK